MQHANKNKTVLLDIESLRVFFCVCEQNHFLISNAFGVVKCSMRTKIVLHTKSLRFCSMQHTNKNCLIWNQKPSALYAACEQKQFLISKAFGFVKCSIPCSSHCRRGFRALSSLPPHQIPDSGCRRLVGGRRCHVRNASHAAATGDPWGSPTRSRGPPRRGLFDPWSKRVRCLRPAQQKTHILMQFCLREVVDL